MAKEILSLQEKMVRIRARIPALVKRTYSEEVNYDFTKIDDIFRYLTPAMNEFQVNWELEAETATTKDASGNPVFVRYLEGPMQWLYEADLVIRWINAELPEDTVSVTLHAIGTHEMPEKAKGSGFTYALKYYLLDKFCIDQGGEDPDLRVPVYSDEENFQTDIFDEGTSQEPDLPKEAENSEHLPVSEHIRPESGRMVELPESASQEPEQESSKSQPAVQVSAQTESASMSFEEACGIVCPFGVLKGLRLGELLKRGADGIEDLSWFAYDYKGKNEELREAARIILASKQAA